MLSWLFSPREAPKSPQLLAAERSFPFEELKLLKSHWARLVHGKPGVDGASFLGWLGLHHADGWVKEHLVSALVNSQQLITFESFLVAKSRCLRQGDDEAARFVFSLIAGQYHGITRSELNKAVNAAAGHALRVDPRLHLDQGAVEAVVDGALQHADQSGILQIDGFRAWCRKMPAVLNTMRGLMSQGTDVNVDNDWSQVPVLDGGPQSRPSTPFLVTPFWAWILSPGVSPAERRGWRLLYNSDLHGKSFSVMTDKILNMGSTILVVKDKQGGLFGGYASQPWSKSGKFYGDFKCYLFRLMPSFEVFKASGANSNFMWCGVNFAALPNGVGFGGQERYYGLFVNSDMDTGMSRQCATYANPSLSPQPVFDTDVIEVWLLLAVESEDDDASGAGKQPGTVMDRMAAEHTIMQLAGVATNHSDAYRKDEPIED